MGGSEGGRGGLSGGGSSGTECLSGACGNQTPAQLHSRSPLVVCSFTPLPVSPLLSRPPFCQVHIHELCTLHGGGVCGGGGQGAGGGEVGEVAGDRLLSGFVSRTLSVCLCEWNASAACGKRSLPKWRR